jgi:hypothetical protein
MQRFYKILSLLNSKVFRAFRHSNCAIGHVQLGRVFSEHCHFGNCRLRPLCVRVFEERLTTWHPGQNVYVGKWQLFVQILVRPRHGWQLAQVLQLAMLKINHQNKNKYT